MNTILNTTMQMIGGLGIFLYGMRVMSESIEEVAGHRLRMLISKMTSNIFRGIMVGVVVTSIIQSSSVTTVMAVGFVNAGLMTLKQSLGIILGADIGTTITGWILALKVTKYGLLLVGGGALVFLFSKEEIRKKKALSIMGLGLIFVGLNFMKAGVRPLKDVPEFIGFFSLFSAESYRGVILSALTGTFLTFVMQSSSATVGITIALATQGVISPQTSVALVLGENIGTTITAYLASLGAGVEAKRVAYAHIMIKVLGVAAILPFFYPYVELVSRFIDPEEGVAKYIALSHTIFNLGVVVMFIPFRGVLLKIVGKMGGKEDKENKVYSNTSIYKVPSVVLEKGRGEVQQMILRFREDIELFYKILSGEGGRIGDIFEGERYQDEKKDAIHMELTGLLNCVSSQKILKEARLLMKVADEVESMGDYGASLGKIYIKIENTVTVINEKGLKNIRGYHKTILWHIDELYRIFRDESYGDIEQLKKSCHKTSLRLSTVDPLEKAEYSHHVEMEILAKYRRINRHIIYILEKFEDESIY